MYWNNKKYIFENNSSLVIVLICKLLWIKYIFYLKFWFIREAFQILRTNMSIIHFSHLRHLANTLIQRRRQECFSYALKPCPHNHWHTFHKNTHRETSKPHIFHLAHRVLLISWWGLSKPHINLSACLHFHYGLLFSVFIP